DAYFEYILGVALAFTPVGAAAAPIAPLLRWFGVIGNEPNRYYRQEETIDRFDVVAGAPRKRSVASARIDANKALSSRVSGRLYEQLPKEDMEFDYDVQGRLTEVRAFVPDPDDPADETKRQMRTVKTYQYDYRGRLVRFHDLVRAGY